jgi:hypothetical protein
VKHDDDDIGAKKNNHREQYIADAPSERGSTIPGFHVSLCKTRFTFSFSRVPPLPDGQAVSVSQSLYIIPDWHCIVHLKNLKISAEPLVTIHPCARTTVPGRGDQWSPVQTVWQQLASTGIIYRPD